MDTKLLRIRQMKKFARWMRMTGYGPNAIDPVFMSVKEIEYIFNHQEEVHKRNDFCRKRKLGNVSYERVGHADRLQHYIEKRYERKKHGHK